MDSNFYALNTTGVLAWSYDSSEGAGLGIGNSAAVDSAGRIYYGILTENDPFLYCLNSNGTLPWKEVIGQIAYSSPAISSDGNIIVGSANGILYDLWEATPTPTPTITPTSCNTPMTINSGAGTASIPVPVATALHGWQVTFVGRATNEAFASVYDSENVSTPGIASGPQYLKIEIRQQDESIHIPAGYEVRYMDGATLRRIWLPELPTP
jgi:hypothetical protein